MKPIYFHIGLHKTGTTFLQRQVFPYIKGINYYGTDTKEKFGWPTIITKKTVVSKERLSGEPYCSPLDDREYILDGIKIKYPNAKIIVCLRDKNSWVKSLYSTYIKDGGTLSELDWVMKVFNISYLEQGEYVKRLWHIFGMSNVLVLYYKDFKNNKHKFIKDICDFMQVDMPQYEDKIVGKSLSAKLLKVIRLLNNFPIKYRTFVHKFDEIKR